MSISLRLVGLPMNLPGELISNTFFSEKSLKFLETATQTQAATVSSSIILESLFEIASLLIVKCPLLRLRL